MHCCVNTAETSLCRKQREFQFYWWSRNICLLMFDFLWQGRTWKVRTSRNVALLILFKEFLKSPRKLEIVQFERVDKITLESVYLFKSFVYLGLKNLTRAFNEGSLIRILFLRVRYTRRLRERLDPGIFEQATNKQTKRRGSIVTSQCRYNTKDNCIQQ